MSVAPAEHPRALKNLRAGEGDGAATRAVGGGDREGGRAANPPAGASAHAIDIDFEEVAMDVVDRAAADVVGGYGGAAARLCPAIARAPAPDDDDDMDMEEGGMNVHNDPFPSFVPPPPYPPSADAWADLSSIVEESGREHQQRRDDLMEVASIGGSLGLRPGKK